jgi:DNA-directed RNA polymerase specialized sigma24 family protein
MSSLLGPTPPFRQGEPSTVPGRWGRTQWSAAESLWPATRWDRAGHLGRGTTRAAQEAWEDLVQRYRAPLERAARRQLARRLGRRPTDADVEDGVQGFLALCFEKEWLLRADPAQGKFRAFVQTLLARYVNDTLDAARAAKRGGRATHEDLGDVGDRAVARAPRPDESLDGDWAALALERAIRAVEREHERYGLVLRDLLRTEGRGSPDLAALLGVHPAQVAVNKTRARQLLRKHFEAELAATVRTPADLDEEWTALVRYLR